MIPSPPYYKAGPPLLQAEGVRLLPYGGAVFFPECAGLSHGEIKKEGHDFIVSFFPGAGDEARTRYLHLGKVALYQMSYTRKRQMLL